MHSINKLFLLVVSYLTDNTLFFNHTEEGLLRQGFFKAATWEDSTLIIID